jgi:Protein of unknown function (DUF3891)
MPGTPTAIVNGLLLENMIRRHARNSFLLITQMAHAHLAAELAAHVGNDCFAAPLPRGQVLQAIELHDAGWPRFDDAPTLNARDEPTDTFEMPLETVLNIWSHSTQLAAADDPYAGLLVSLHGLGLSLRAKVDPGPGRPFFAMMKFQQEQIEIQEQLRRTLGLRVDQPLRQGLAEPGRSAEEDLLLCNFGLLEFADQLSLNLCYDTCRFPALEDFFPRPGERPITLAVRRDDAGWFTVDPWPFDRDTLQFRLPAGNVMLACLLKRPYSPSGPR